MTTVVVEEEEVTGATTGVAMMIAVVEGTR